MTETPTTEQLFWAREFVKLARDQAKQKGIPDQIMAQAMLVQAWMLFTGQTEDEARKAVQGLFSASVNKHFAATGATSGQPGGTGET